MFSTFFIICCVTQGFQLAGIPNFWPNSYFWPTFCFYSYFLTKFILLQRFRTKTKILLNNSAQILRIYLHICLCLYEPLIWFKKFYLKFKKMVSKCKMYKHLLHLIHYSYFFGRFILLYSIPTSILLFVQIPTSPTFYLSYLLDTLDSTVTLY